MIIKKKEKKMIISGLELMIHSANKEGGHDDYVRTGCGAHKSAKDYKRKSKHRKKDGYDE